MAASDRGLQFVLKVASRCNLNCTYCYVYNKADRSWRDHPAFMPEPIFSATLERLRAHCLYSGQRKVRITFHGGEPCLAGPGRFADWCRRTRAALQDITEVSLSLQTNGTLLDERWIELFLEHQVGVGISLDGPAELHDRFRVDHRGRGSYARVERGIDLLRRAGIPLQILSVVQPGADGLRVHRHFLDLGAIWINYLLPDFTHDTIAPVRERYGPTPSADFLIPIFDDWWSNGTLAVKIPLFWNIARLVLGGDSEMDFLGNKPFGFVFVGTDGAIEGLDVLRVCKEGLYGTGLNVLTDEFMRITEVSDLHRAAILDGMPLPSGCRACPERSTCAGGYLPHRYSEARGFDNPSVWCADLLRLFGHIRARLGVTVEETARRREQLRAATAAGAPRRAATR